jgi:alpha-galactosidase
MKKLKIAIIGAGSRDFGPAMIKDILLSDISIEFDLEIALMDIVAEHLKDNERFCHFVKEKLNRSVKVISTTDLQLALKDADYVIAAVEVERYQYWAMDFHIPRKYGFKQVYGENGGPGGIFHALRNLGPMLEIARTMEILCPDTWLLNFTNPEQKLCEAINRLTKIKVAGLCHGVFMGRHQVAQILEMDPLDIDVKACGINHFTFFQELKAKKTGEDLYPALRKAEAAGHILSNWHEIGLGRVLFHLYGLWPSPGTNHYGEYIRWAEEFLSPELQFYYDPMSGNPWETKKYPKHLYTIEWVNTAKLSMKDELDKSGTHVSAFDRPIEKSEELAIPIIEGLLLDRKLELQAVILPNRGLMPQMPDEATVEVPAMVDKNGIHPFKMEPLPDGLAGMLQIQCTLNKIIVDAFSQKSKKLLLQAVLLDPVVDSYKNAVFMVNEMLELQKDILGPYN